MLKGARFEGTTGKTKGASYEVSGGWWWRIVTLVVAVLVLVVAGGGGCARVVVDCGPSSGEQVSPACPGGADPESSPEPVKPPVCVPMGGEPGDLCQEEDRACWPTRKGACGLSGDGFLCGYPSIPPKGCWVSFAEVPPGMGPVPIWCCGVEI